MSSGGRATRSATSRAGSCSGRPTAARASRARWATSGTASPGRASRTSRSEWASGERPMTDDVATRQSPEEAADEALKLADTILERALRVGATEAEVLV